MRFSIDDTAHIQAYSLMKPLLPGLLLSIPSGVSTVLRAG